MPRNLRCKKWPQRSELYRIPECKLSIRQPRNILEILRKFSAAFLRRQYTQIWQFSHLLTLMPFQIYIHIFSWTQIKVHWTEIEKMKNFLSHLRLRCFFREKYYFSVLEISHWAQICLDTKSTRLCQNFKNDKTTWNHLLYVSHSINNVGLFQK